MEDHVKTSTIAILKAALHNAGVIQDQIGSLDDDYPMPHVVQQLEEAVDAIQKELEALDAS